MSFQSFAKIFCVFAVMTAVIAICITTKTARAQTPQASNRSANKAPRPHESCASPSGALRTVVGVPDARTLLLDNGTEVRLTGALPPFSPAASAANSPVSVPWPPLEQAHKALMKLAQAQTVQLAARHGKPNRYGQNLAQVYLIPRKSADQPTRAPIWLQGYMIVNGLARAHPSGTIDPCLETLIELETQARTAQTGLWRTAAFQIRDAARPDALNKLIGSFQIIEGRVFRTGGGRNKVYLNFGKDWRRDFTIGVSRKQARHFAKEGLNLRRLRGRLIRVRGWLDWRGGPYIQALSAAQIEVLADN